MRPLIPIGNYKRPPFILRSEKRGRMNTQIIIERVSKKYKDCIAVNDVSMKLEGPIIYGLVGKNGAGKTTLLKMIAGLAKPTSGAIERTGGAAIGTLIETPGLYGHLSARDNLIVKLKMAGDHDDSHADALLERVGLAGAAGKKTRGFSLGMKQRLGIAMALVGDPDVLLLDEPINGLDPEGVVLIRNLIRELRDEKRIIIVSSHILEELSKVSDRYGILENGRLIREFDASELSEDESEGYLISVDDEARAIALLSRDGVRFLKEDRFILIEGDEALANLTMSRLFAEGVCVRELRKKGSSLEDILLTGGNDHA